MSEPTNEEESGPPVGGTAEPTTPPLRTPITLVPPPLSPQQVQDVIDAINAVKKAVQSVGSLAWPLVKWAFGKAIEGLRAIPTAPLTPSLGTQEPSTPPPTTP
jgi:hypothetical protein